MTNKASITIESKYHRDQFDDWLAGGKVEYKGRIYYWSAQDSNYGFGWEIEPIDEEDWSNLNQNGCNELIRIIEECLPKHETEYIVQVHLLG